MADLSHDAQIALTEMIDEYDRGLEDERRLRDRPTAADRTLFPDVAREAAERAAAVVSKPQVR